MAPGVWWHFGFLLLTFCFSSYKTLIMKKINVAELNDNVFDTVGKEWMLVTSGSMGNFNTMTASWGCFGWLWNKPVAVAFIRPERYTHEFVENNEMLTLSFLGKEADMRKVYSLCGSKSGRECDKVAEANLTPVETVRGNVAFVQSRLTFECAKLYKDGIKPDHFVDPSIAGWYGESKGGYHDVYVLEILDAYVK